MPNVPYQAYGDEQRPLRRVYISDAGVSPNAFGAQVGGALRDMGQSLDKWADLSNQHALAMQQLTNDTDSRNIAMGGIQGIAERETQFKMLTGKDAVDGQSQYNSDIQQINKQTIAQGKNPIQQKMIADDLYRQTGYALTNGSSHAGEQGKLYAKQTFDAQVALNKDLPITDEKEMNDIRLPKIEQGIKEGNPGLPPERIEQMVRENKSEAISKFIMSQVTDRPMYARQLLDRYKDQITANHLPTIQQSVQSGMEHRGASEGADAIVNGGTLPGDPAGGGTATPGHVTVGPAVGGGPKAQVAHEAAVQGVNPRVALAIGMQESDLRPGLGGRATNKGIFQLTDSDRAALGTSDDVKGGVTLVKKASDAARTVLGREPTIGEIYTVYNQGIAGGKAILADPKGDYVATMAQFGEDHYEKVRSGNPKMYAEVKTNQDVIDHFGKLMQPRLDAANLDHTGVMETHRGPTTGAPGGQPISAPQVQPQAGQSPAGKPGMRPIDLMRTMTGLSEGRNADVINSFITRYGGAHVDVRETPWCAGIVNGVLGAAGIEGTHSLAARSFLGWGTSTDKPQEGDIVVLSRGGDTSKGHVGFFAGYDANGNVTMVGGNQSNQISTITVPRDRVLSFRSVPKAGGPMPEGIYAPGARSNNSLGPLTQATSEGDYPKYLQRAREWAEAQPGATQNFVDNTVSRVQTRIAEVSRQNLEVRRDASHTITDAVVGNIDRPGISSMDDVKNDPKLFQAWQHLEPEERGRLMKEIERNAKGDKVMMDEPRWQRYNYLSGLRYGDGGAVKEFMDTDVWKEDLPVEKKAQLDGEQQILRQKQGRAPANFGVAETGAQAQINNKLKTLGLWPGGVPKEQRGHVQELYSQFIGQWNASMKDWADNHGGKIDQDTKIRLGNELLKDFIVKRQTPSTFLGIPTGTQETAEKHYAFEATKGGIASVNQIPPDKLKQIYDYWSRTPDGVSGKQPVAADVIKFYNYLQGGGQLPAQQQLPRSQPRPVSRAVQPQQHPMSKGNPFAAQPLIHPFPREGQF